MFLPPDAYNEGVFLLSKMIGFSLTWSTRLETPRDEVLYYEQHSRWCEKYDQEHTGMSATADWCKDEFHIGKRGVNAVQARIDRLIFLLKENGYEPPT